MCKSLYEKYEKLKLNYYDSIEEDNDKGLIREEQYEDLIEDIISYDDFLGNISDMIYEDSLFETIE